MTAPMSAPVASAVSRFKGRLSHSWQRSVRHDEEAAPQHLPAIASARPVGFPARIAEFLLILRLRARRPAARSGDILERAVRVMFVTCQSWFGARDLLKQRPYPHD